MRIDGHHHLWDPGKRRYYWMEDDSLAPIRRPIGPEDMRPLLAAARIDGTIIVQAVPDAGETTDMLQQAAATSIVRGVVGWADLTTSSLAETLEAIKASQGGDYLVAIRHQAHDEEDAEWLARPEVIAGIRTCHEAGLAYDLLVRERELPAAIACVEALPEDVRLVVDHIAKPRIASGAMQPWLDLMRRIASYPNVYCKLSGMVTEADWHNWSVADLAPYANCVIELFGPDRVMFGSDWPVSLLAAPYERVVATCEELISELPDSAQKAIMGANAQRFYRLPARDEDRTDVESFRASGS